MIVLTQRVMTDAGSGERRDALDQRWTAFLSSVGLTAIPLPNKMAMVRRIVETQNVTGAILTGGDDLISCGGGDREREEVEEYLIGCSIENAIPLLGVCRGMQSIQQFFGCRLTEVAGHVRSIHPVLPGKRVVNSFHRFGAREACSELKTAAISPDGVIESVIHRRHRLAGIMWHPERTHPFHEQDRRIFIDAFGAASCRQ